MWTIVRRYPERGSCLAFVTIAGIILYLTVIAFRGQTSYLNILKARRERHTTNNESVTNNLATGLQLATTNSTTFGFDSVNSLVLFIGYPRSGHTLVGSLLDAHPHVVIANEYKLLQHWRLFDKEQKTRSYVFGELYRDSEMQAKEGYRSATVKHIFNYSVPNQWNGQFDKFLQLIGDKHGPKTTEFLKNENQRTIVDEIRRRLKVSVRFLHVVRNPFDDIATMAVRQVEGRQFIEQGKVLDNLEVLNKQIRSYFYLISINSVLLKKYNVLTIYSEDLIAKPKSVISTICDFLELRCSARYLFDCASLVFGNVSRTRNNVVWTSKQRVLVGNGIMKYSFLHRYAAHTLS